MILMPADVPWISGFRSQDAGVWSCYGLGDELGLVFLGVSMPSEECRCPGLWKIPRYSNRALASSIRVRDRAQRQPPGAGPINPSPAPARTTVAGMSRQRSRVHRVLIVPADIARPPSHRSTSPRDDTTTLSNSSSRIVRG